jgi:hypothetical protein
VKAVPKTDQTIFSVRVEHVRGESLLPILGPDVVHGTHRVFTTRVLNFEIFQLDVAVDDLEVAVNESIAFGAKLAECQPQEEVRVLLDPEGHPFCL